MSAGDEFYEAMLALYEQTGKLTGYWSKRFLGALKRDPRLSKLSCNAPHKQATVEYRRASRNDSRKIIIISMSAKFSDRFELERTLWWKNLARVASVDMAGTCQPAATGVMFAHDSDASD